MRFGNERFRVAPRLASARAPVREASALGARGTPSKRRLGVSYDLRGRAEPSRCSVRCGFASWPLCRVATPMRPIPPITADDLLCCCCCCLFKESIGENRLDPPHPRYTFDRGAYANDYSYLNACI